MIRTRPTETQTEDLGIVGDGPYLLAVSFEQLEMIACFMGMVTGSSNPSIYEEAAHDLLDMCEVAASDPDFGLSALENIMPMLEVHEPITYNVVGDYDADHSFEFKV